MVAVLPAFRDGSNALRSNPILFVAGLLLAGGSQLQRVGEFVESPPLEVGASLAWVLLFPFLLGGFIGMARAALEGSDASLTHFVSAGRRYYRRLLFATILFVLLVVAAFLVLSMFGFITGFGGALALGAIDERAAFAAAVAVSLVWLALLLGVIMFLQFYDTAIVIEDTGVTEAFRRSVHLVRSNLKGVVGFSVVWVLLLNLFLVPEYLVELLLTDADATTVLPVDVGIPVQVLLPIGAVLSAVGFAYFYTVYTAFYVRLIRNEPTDRDAA
ncbi:hypothetical protein [Halobellus litoreus]|uniref:DUF7847 domain-containing protein n=1 Tax=Halobellus litoreus TaxID=755310 RepID=A0ABD6DTH0_9EURY|nr:hypothetical protein [Halobellus litoreus]